MTTNFADKFSRLVALKPVAARTLSPLDPEPSISEHGLARMIGATIAKTRFGEHLSVRNWYSTPEAESFSPSVIDLLMRAKNFELTKKQRAALDDPSRWLFLDTETTGLAGGTGTYAFLIGVAWWDAGGLQVEQFLMRDFAEEHSALSELASRLEERSVLVTFNGKTFDWPLLENRFTMTRSIRVPNLAAHLDLLHPARAIWRLRLGSVRLSELERQVLDPARLGWTREDDVPSAQIPQFYFDFLRGGPATPLAGVVRHNAMDLRGLAALVGKIDSLLCAEARHEETDGLDLFGVSRFLHRRGERGRAHQICAQALQIGLPDEHRQRATFELAHHAKRNGEHEAAARLWEQIVSDSHQGIAACEQLAIHHERHEKDPRRALEFVELALMNLRKAMFLSRDRYATPRLMRCEEQLIRRRDRLRIKCDAPLPLLKAKAVKN